MYELAFHISPDIEESAASARARDVETLINQGGGSVTASREPKKIHLSYPLAHHHYAYFVVVDFESQPEAIDQLDAQMKLQEGILRFLILKKPDANSELRTFGEHRPRSSLRTHTAPTTSDKKEVIEPKKIEKELEDVLEKI